MYIEVYTMFILRQLSQFEVDFYGMNYNTR